MENNNTVEKDYSKMSETDIAYRILADLGEPIYYKTLITDVIDKKKKSVQSMAVAISEIYTMINMDGRFQYRGDNGEGKWGLTEWTPPEVKRTRMASQAISAGDEGIPKQSAAKGIKKRKTDKQEE
ncbi:MAG: DNA-directed RNA polymerase subunit delta [Selenomonadaceae bacterium]|nr:DNA-directed RNA polymerase subunit delta [Selenomonadaceae bacterium]